MKGAYLTEIMINEEEFREIFERKLPIILKMSKNRNIWIYGAGVGGEIINKVLDFKGIKFNGFIDRNYKKLNRHKHKIGWLSDINPVEDFIIVSLREVEQEIIDTCLDYGFDYMDIYYVASCEGRFNKEDTIIGGTMIGRGTYGYENMLNSGLLENVGRYTSISETANIYRNHSIDAVTTYPIINPLFVPWEVHIEKKEKIKNQNIKGRRMNKKVHIGNDVWIAANVMIMPGVCIGDGAVVAAGAVVTKDVEAYSVVGGVPAKFLKYRFSPKIIERLKKIKWWNWSHEKVLENVEYMYDINKFVEMFGE